jgi:cytochrome c oxidase subunit 3
MTPDLSARHLAIQFEDVGKQTHAALLAMWIVVGSEVLLFAGLFALYAAYRAAAPSHEWADAVRHTSLTLGTTMTFGLITSSLTVALAVDAMREGRARATGWWLAASVALGAIFLGLKGFEYALHVGEGIKPGVYFADPALPTHTGAIFFTLYYFMTGLHALHVIVGMILLAGCGWGVRRRAFDASYHTPLELSAMYWHLVDVVWIFLWPMFYLMH